MAQGEKPGRGWKRSGKNSDPQPWRAGYLKVSAAEF